jgi:hypothetical protein
MRKTKSSQILYLCLFFFFLACFLFISQCFFVNFTPNSGKRREKCRERISNRCFPITNYTTVLFFSFPFFFFFLLEYLFCIIVVLSFYIFSIFIFGAYVFSFCFGPLYFFFFCFLIFSYFSFYFISINSRKRQEKEFLFIVSQ